MSAPEVRRLQGWRLAAFAAAALPAGALNTPLTVYLPAHYSSYVGLSLGAVGLAFALVRTLDIGVDPLVGWLVDRTQTRFGQCRPWLALGGVLLLSSCTLLFFARPGATLGRLLVGLLVAYAGVSVVGVAHPAWASRLSRSYHDRSHIFAWLYVGQSLGALLLLGTPAILDLLAHGGVVAAPDAGTGVVAMGWALLTSIPVLFAVSLVAVREPAAPTSVQGAAPAALRDYLRLLASPTILRLFVADALVSLATGFSIPLFVLFFRARNVRPEILNAMVMAYLVAALASVPAWTRIAARLGKHRAMIASAGGYVLVLPAMAVIPAARLDLLFPALAFMGLTFAASSFLIRAMAADASDEIRLRLGVDRTGQVYALLAATQKLGAALALGFAFGCLERFGFNAAAPLRSPPAALMALTVMYVAAPAALMALGALALVGYRLDAARHAAIVTELEAGSAAPISAP